MYSVSDAFKTAIKQPVIQYDLSGTVGSVSFTQENIVSGTFHISNQCTDTNNIVLGSAYVGQLDATFTGLNINRNDWIDKVITVDVDVLVAPNSHETVPMGIFTIKEVYHTAEGTQVKAYDNMYKFDKLLDATRFDFNGEPYAFLQRICADCGVTLGMTQAQVEDLPNGEHTMYMCGCRKETTDYASDVETYRDALFYLAQACACFATINRSGALELRKYRQGTTDTVTEMHRIAGAEFADYVTSYTGLYVESLWAGYTTFYGYDLEELQQNKADAEAREEEELDAIGDIEADIAELVRKHNAHEITDEEYETQRAELDAELKVAQSALKMTRKYLKWVNSAIAIAQRGDTGVSMDLGGNPFLQHKDSELDPISDVTTATVLRTAILKRLSKIEYVPFSCSTVFGIHYDLGDRIMFTGGHADDDLGCIMSYDWTYNGEYVMSGYGAGSDAEANLMSNVRPKADKEANRANINALNRPELELKELGDPSDESAMNPVKLTKRGAGNEITKTIYMWSAWRYNASTAWEDGLRAIHKLTITIDSNFAFCNIMGNAVPDNLKVNNISRNYEQTLGIVVKRTDNTTPPTFTVDMELVYGDGDDFLKPQFSNAYDCTQRDYDGTRYYLYDRSTAFGAVVHGIAFEYDHDKIDFAYPDGYNAFTYALQYGNEFFDIHDLKQGDVILPTDTEGKNTLTKLKTLRDKVKVDA